MILYTSGSASRIYHIVLERNRTQTLCGLRVTNPKAVLSEKPSTGELCKHCERLGESELPDSPAPH